MTKEVDVVNAPTVSFPQICILAISYASASPCSTSFGFKVVADIFASTREAASRFGNSDGAFLSGTRILKLTMISEKPAEISSTDTTSTRKPSF